MTYNVTGILLAGGKSSRMGKDKALLKYGDETFMSASLKKLNKLFDEVIVVADNLEKYQVENIKFITDIYPGMGPIGGIHAALKAAKNDWIFVIPCDMPMWETFLVEELLKHRFDNDIVVPLINNQIEPLFALYKKTCIPGIEKCINSNLIKVIELYPLVKTNYLDLEKVFNEVEECTKSFFNINTPKDLYNMVKIRGLKTNVDLEMALKLLLSNTKVSDKTEHVHINDALGRVLSKDIYAPRNLPELRRSFVDGYAISDDDIDNLNINGFVKLNVTDEVPAGFLPANTLLNGSTQSLMTGAVLPLNTAAVVMHEYVEKENSQILVKGSVKKGQNIIEAGSDIKKGIKIASGGDKISPEILSILAFNGISSIPIYSIIKASIISTGSELILPGEYNMTKTYNSNMYLADSILKGIGVKTLIEGIVPDNAARLSEKLSEAMKQSDIVISFGGAFVGEYDLMEQSLLMLGAEIIFSGINVKPGKSFIAAKKDETLFLCLSGSPGSAYNNIELIVKPAIKKLMGMKNIMPQKIQVKMPADYINKRPYRRLLQGRLYLEKGELKFNIFEGKSIFDCLKEINILIDVPKEAHLKANDLINAYYIKEN